MFYRRRFLIISSRFAIRARVGDDIIDFSGLLIALATLDALCWIMYVIVSFKVSMQSSSFSVTNRFLYSKSIFLYPICVASSLGGLLVILSTCTSSLMLLISMLRSPPMLIWLMTVRFVLMSGLFVRM